MRDEHFEMFVEEFGEATTRIPVPTPSFDLWRTKLPTALLDYWRQEGWSGYADGLFWIVNPDDYEDVLLEWIAGTALEKIDRFHVIARTAFGTLFLWGEKTGPSARLVAWDHSILCLERDLRRPVKNADLSVRGIFSGSEKGDSDTLDEAGRPLFDRAFKKLGGVGPDEMYGFEPAIIAGGSLSIENIRIVKTIEHLGMLRQFGGPRFPMGTLNIDKLV